MSAKILKNKRLHFLFYVFVNYKLLKAQLGFMQNLSLKKLLLLSFCLFITNISSF